VLKYMTGRNEAERQDRRVVLSAVAAERVEFGDSTGMAASVRRELELPWRGGCTYDAAAMQREKFDLQAVLGAALSVGEVGSPLRLGRLAGEGRGDVARHPQFHLLLGGRQ
jgi:hypothetical protein